MKSKTKLISSVTAFAIMTASGVSIPQASAQEATAPAVTQTAPSDNTKQETSNTSSDNTKQETSSTSSEATTVLEFPEPQFKKNTSESSVVVTGTKDWDKDLELSPTGKAEVKANISLNGEVPEGTKVGIYDGDTLIEEAPVVDGKVSVTTSKLPKDVHKFTIKSEQADLSSMKCSADKGIDIPASEDATLEAIKDYEKEYEAAKKEYEKAAENMGKTPSGSMTVTTQVPDQTITTTTTVPGETITPPPTTGDDKANFGILTPILRLLPIGGLLAGAGALAGNPDISKIADQLGNNVGDLLNNPQINQLIGQFQNAFQNGGNEGLQDLLDQYGIKGVNIDQIQQQAQQMINQIQGQLQALLQEFGSDLIPGIDLSGIQLPNFDVNALMPLLGALLAIIALPALVGLGGSPSNPGEENTGDTIVGADRVVTSTSVIPGGVKTSVIPAAGGEVPVPELPVPPKFIEETLGQRDVDLNTVNGGVEFEIEAGSVLDCSVDVKAKAVEKQNVQPQQQAPAQQVRQIAPASVPAQAVEGPKVNTGGEVKNPSVATRLEQIFG